MRNRIHIMIIMIVVALVAVTQTLIAGDAYWIAGVSGDWDNDANWNTPPTTNDSIFINGSGNYTSIWDSSSLATVFSNITVGVSASGEQVLRFTGPVYQDLALSGDIVVGANGLVEQNNSLTGPPSGSYATIQVMDGGVWRATNPDTRASSLGGNRILQVDVGGIFDIPEGIQVTSKTTDEKNIINGELTGEGTFYVSAGATCRMAGTGVVDVAKILMPSNGLLYFYGNGPVVNSEIYPSSSGGLMLEGPGTMIFNGDVLYTNKEPTVLRGHASDERTITGNGDFLVSSAKAINILGYSYESAGKLYLTGTGKLLMNLKGYTGTCYGSMDLGRESVISNGVLVLSMDKTVCINVTNEAGKVLMNDLSVVIQCGSASYRAPASMKVSDNGTITFDNVDITTAAHKTKLTLMNIEVSDGNSGGTLKFASGS